VAGGGQAVEVQVEPRQWTDQVGLAVQGRKQGSRLWPVFLHKVLFDLLDRDVQPAVRHDPALGQRVVRRVAQCDVDEFLPVHGHRQRGGPGDQFFRLRQCRAQLDQHGVHFGLGRCAEESADPGTHGMYRTAAEEADKFIAQALETQTAPHRLRVFLGHADHTVEAEKIRCGEQMNMQRMALQPLAAVEHPSHVPYPAAGVDAEGVLQRLRGSHLVGDRADAADPRGDVEDLFISPALEEFLEVTGWLEEIQGEILDEVVFYPYA
jgi:hypothetical protein